MTYQEKVDYLKSYKEKYYRLLYVENQMQGIKGISYDENRTGSKKTQLDYIEEKILLEKEMKEIEQSIKAIKDIRSRYVLIYKFIEFKSLEEIVDLMSYSLPQIKRFYKKGVNMIPNDTK